MAGWRITVIGLALSLVHTGCFGSSVPAGPVVSPTGIVYEPGTPPRRTRFAQTAALYLSQGLVERALEIALEGVEQDPENPVHYFLAGLAFARLSAYEQADVMFEEAQRIYPAYELEIEPERAAGWADAYNQGVQAFDTANVELAMEAWRLAATIYDLRPEAHRNLASRLTTDGEGDEAIEWYKRALAGLEKKPATRVLSEEEIREREEDRISTEDRLAQLLLFADRFAEAEPLLRRQLERDSASVSVLGDLAAALVGQGRADEAEEIYSDILSESSIESMQLFNLGVALFRAKDFDRASEAFARLTLLRPSSRDVWFNYVNALFAAQDWEPLAAAGNRLVELDPLGESAGLIAARAHFEIGDEDAALEGLQRIDSAPIHLEGLEMRPFNNATRVQGRIVGNQAELGTPLRLLFTFYDDARTIGREFLTVTAPTSGESAPLEVFFDTRATAYRYEVAP